MQRTKPTELENRAKGFAERAHSSIDQRRKYTGDPYIVHPGAVAEIVRLVDGHTQEMLAAAWLHDVVEDTPISIEQIEAEFGGEVAQLVEMLTDVSRPEDGNRAQRKQIDLEHTALASPEAKTIKLADLIDNSETIQRYDPNFAMVYMKEKRRLLGVLKEGDQTLWNRANEIVLGYMRTTIEAV